MITASMIPIIIVPLTFLFVLLIILIAKAPKVGAWIVGSLVLLAPVCLWRLVTTGAFRHDEGVIIPLVVVPVTFLFVLMVILLAKAPKAAVGLIITLVVMGALVAFVGTAVSHRSAAHVTGVYYGDLPATVVEQQTQSNAGSATANGKHDEVYRDFVPPVSPTPPVISPIWSEGAEQEFEADVYPSSLAAAKALGRRMVQPIRTVVGDPNAAIKVVLFQVQENSERNVVMGPPAARRVWQSFQEDIERSVVTGFGHALEKELSGVPYSIEADLRNVQPGEVGVTLRLDRKRLAEGTTGDLFAASDNTRIIATAFAGRRRASAEARFIPWVESEANQPAAQASAIAEATVREVNRVLEASVQAPRAPEAAIPPMPQTPVVASPIWADGIDTELEAEVYPSKLAAVRALGSRVDRSIRRLMPDANSPAKIVLFQEQNDRALIVEFKNAIQRTLFDATCAIEAEPRNIEPDETAITVRFADTDMQPAPWARSPEIKAASARVEINVSTAGGHMATGKRFIEKPWVEDFATFASTRPDQHFIVTRSLGTCTSEGEAHQQALDDARARLTEVLGKRGRLPQPAITATDVLKGGFVVDQFAQSFEGSVGKIWRQAMLIDVSGDKLAQLFTQKTHESRQIQRTWARMGFSVIGVTVLISAIYFFLNMATRGYYEWSLRIAGIVLAIVAVVSVLMMVR